MKSQLEEKIRAEFEAKAKAEEEAKIMAELEAKAKAAEEAKMKAELEAKIRAELEAEAKAEEEARTKVEQEAKEEARAKAEVENMIKEEQRARIKAEEEAKVKAKQAFMKKAQVDATTESHQQVDGTASNVLKPDILSEESNEKNTDSIAGNRMTELERLEREFGLSDSNEHLNGKNSNLSIPGIQNLSTASREMGLESLPGSGNGIFENIQEKHNLIEKEQSEVSARLISLERTSKRGTQTTEEKNVENYEDMDETNLEDLRFLEEITRKEKGLEGEELVTSPEHNLVDDEDMMLAHTITKSDEVYEPSQKTLSSTALLMKEVAGTSLENFSGKESYLSEKDVAVQAGNTLNVPIRVSAPGSIVEFSIEKKSYDFSFGITAVLDEGEVAKIKEMAPFLKKSDTQKIVVPAGSAPCTMQFKFANNYATLLEKVRLNYTIRVIPPSAETVMLGRKRRTKASLESLEVEILSQREILKTSKLRVAELQRDEMDLQNKIDEKSDQLESIRAEEERLKNLLSAAKQQAQIPKKTSDGNKFLNEF